MVKLAVKFMVLITIVVVSDHLAASFLKKGMDKRFSLERNAAVLCIGNSHTLDGIDRDLLEKGLGESVAKYAFRGFNTFDRLAMIKHYVSEHPGALRLVVYDVDDHTFTSGRNDSKAYTALYPFMGNSEIGLHVNESAGSWGEYVSRKWLWMLRYTPDLRNFALGALINKRSFNRGTVSVEEIKRDIILEGKSYGDTRVDADNVRCFEETVRYVRSQGAKLVLVYIPVTDLWNSMVSREKHRAVLTMLENYSAINDTTIFLNYKEKYEHHHELYYDRTHLNVNGMKLLTSDLVTDLIPYMRNYGSVREQ